MENETDRTESIFSRHLIGLRTIICTIWQIRISHIEYRKSSLLF